MARRINKIMMTRGGRIAAESVFDGFADSYKQVGAPTPQPGNPVVNGGLIPVTTHTPVVVTIGNSQNQVEKNNIPRPYPEDKSGNGGGGKMGLKF
jgi:hypothetical protein